jgi:hypothetical protein
LERQLTAAQKPELPLPAKKKPAPAKEHEPSFRTAQSAPSMDADWLFVGLKPGTGPNLSAVNPGSFADESRGWGRTKVD